MAVFPAVLLGEAGYAARSHTSAAEASSRHRVDAVAVGNAKTDPTMSDSAPAKFSVPVRWFAQNASRDAEVKIDRHHRGFRDIPRSVLATATSSASGMSSTRERAAARTAAGHGSGRSARKTAAGALKGLWD